MVLWVFFFLVGWFFVRDIPSKSLRLLLIMLIHINCSRDLGLSSYGKQHWINERKHSAMCILYKHLNFFFFLVLFSNKRNKAIISDHGLGSLLKQQ